jgi:hypothetical protein
MQIDGFAGSITDVYERAAWNELCCEYWKAVEVS